jgi:hypothetical protein
MLSYNKTLKQTKRIYMFIKTRNVTINTELLEATIVKGTVIVFYFTSGNEIEVNYGSKEALDNATTALEAVLQNA